MATDFLDRCDAIEECYEFMLGYAGRGIPGERGSEIRRHLERAAAALDEAHGRFAFRAWRYPVKFERKGAHVVMARATNRIGQTQHVFAYRLICGDTVEEKILELQNSKRDLAAAIIGAESSVIRNLKPEDLELLLS